MRKKLTINIDEDLLSYTADCFGYHENINYSHLIEHALLYFLKPQGNKSFVNNPMDTEINHLLIDPEIDIDAIEKKYSFDLASIEGKWPSDEPIEQLLQMLSK